MTHKRLPKAVLFALAAACVLTACSGEPAPFEASTPSPVASQGGQYLGFDTEEEAIAAAEEVYVKYLDEGQRYWAGDVDADPTQYLMLAAYEAELEARAAVSAQGLKLETDPVSQTLEASLVDRESIVLLTCEQLGGRVLDRGGNDVTPSDRPDKQALRISVERDADGELRIASSAVEEDPRC